MKKLFILSLITLLIVPQVAFAAWWNPFTWNWAAFFNTPSTQNEAVGEPSTSTTISTSSVEVSTQKKPATKQDFKADLIQIADVNIKMVNDVLEYEKSQLNYVNKMVELTKDRINYSEGLNIYDDKDLDNLTNIDRKSLIAYQRYIDYFSNQIPIMEHNLAIAEATKKDISFGVYTDAAKVKDKLIFLNDARSALVSSMETITKEANNFQTVYDVWNSTYMQGVTILRAYTSGGSSQFTDYSQTTKSYNATVQPIKVPDINYHSCLLTTVGGGGVDLVVKCN